MDMQNVQRLSAGVALFFNFEIHLLICVVLTVLWIVLVTFDGFCRFFLVSYFCQIFMLVRSFISCFINHKTHTHTHQFLTWSYRRMVQVVIIFSWARGQSSHITPRHQLAVELSYVLPCACACACVCVCVCVCVCEGERERERCIIACVTLSSSFCTQAFMKQWNFNSPKIVLQLLVRVTVDNVF